MQRWLTSPGRRALTGLIVAAVPIIVGITFGFNVLNRSLAPYNIVSYEFAWTAERAVEMFAVWGELGVGAARLSLQIDFLYIPVYGLLSWALALFAARASTGRWQSVGVWIAFFPFIAGGCDAIENLMLLNNLPPASPSTTTLTLAGVCAALKFGLLIVCWLYTLAAPLGKWLRR
jgi:hypothetical protein